MVGKLYVARDKDNTLALFKDYPQKMNNERWVSCHTNFLYLNRKYFPEVTFDNSPIEVELKLKNKHELK